ncbi:glycosyltransferase family 4 protein [Natrialbaceae archaeon A-CW3]
MNIDVLYIVSTLRQSGPTNQLYGILQNIHDGVDVSVLTLSPEPSNSEYEQFNQLDINIQSLNLSRIESATIGSFRLRSIVNDIDPDVVHSQGIRADTLSAHLLSKYNRITTIRNNPYKDYPAKYGDVQGRLMAWKHVDTYRRLDHTVACSHTIADQISEFGVSPKVIQNGVDCSAYSPVSIEQRKQLRDKHRLNQYKYVGVFTGSLIPRKAPETAIRGFLQSEIASDGALVFLGDGPLREQCEYATSSYPNIRFEGWVDNVETYLNAADYFLSPSKAEGLPNSVMEALATGLPVCLSDIGPHKEILQYDSQVGISFTVENEVELGNQLDTLLSTDLESRSQTAREIARTKLSAKRMSQQYQNLYTKIC